MKKYLPLLLLLFALCVASCEKDEPEETDNITVGIDYDHKITSGYGD